MKKSLRTYYDFRGGLNKDAAPDNLAENELREAINVDLDERGAVSKRRGTAPLNETSYGAQVERIIEWKKKDGSRVLLAIVGTTLAKIAEDGTKTDIKTLDNADIGHFFYADFFYFTGKESGVDGYWRYNGTEVESLQLAAPSASPTLAGSGSGTSLAAGTYKALVTYVNSTDIESPPCTEVSVTITSGQKIDWTNIPIGPAGTAKRKLYRTTKGSDVFRLIKTISDNTTTTATDTKADSSNTGDIFTLNDLAPIKRCRRFIWHSKSQRIFAARDSSDMAALYYSEPGDPAYFKETSKLYPTTGDGPAYALSYIGEAMVAIYQHSLWVWKGSDPESDAQWYALPSNNGTVANLSVALTPNSLTFLGQGGIVSISPGLIDSNIAMVVGDELIKDRSESKVSSIIRSVASQEITCSVYDRTNLKYILAYTDETGGTRNTKMLVLDWSIGGFSTYEGLAANDIMQRANGDILIASDGYILKMNDTYKDFDISTGQYKAIRFFIETKQWSLGSPVQLKKARKLFLNLRQQLADQATIDVTVYSDYKNIAFEDVEIDESFIWGDTWGDRWGFDELVEKEMKCGLKGQRFSVTVENNNIDQPVTIYGHAFEFKLKKPKGVKVPNGKTS